MHKHTSTVIDRAIAQNRKITDQDVDQSTTLQQVARDFVQNYKGSNKFVQDIAVRMADYGLLSVPQMRGALNVMVAEAKASRRDNHTVEAAQNDKPQTQNFYDYQLQETLIEAQIKQAQRVTDELLDDEPMQMPEGDYLNTSGMRVKPLVLDFNSRTTVVRTFDHDGSTAYDEVIHTPLESLPDSLQSTEVATPVVSVVVAASAAPEPSHKAVPNGIYTIVLNDAGDYRTIKLSDCPDSFNKPQGTQIASYLSGSDNESNYTGFAFVDSYGVQMWKRFSKAVDLSFALQVLKSSDDKYLECGKAYALKSGNCFICNRRLTTPDSIKSGIGPICAGKLGIDQQSLIKTERPSYEQALADVNELFND